MPSTQQTKVKTLEWVVYLQNSENMAGLNSPLACTNWFCTSGKLNKDHKTGMMYCVLCIVYSSIVPVFKKESIKDCGNYRGIYLFSMARILLNRINKRIPPNILPET